MKLTRLFNLKAITCVLVIAAVAVNALAVMAQDGVWHTGADDGRLNVADYLGSGVSAHIDLAGVNVYCVDENHNAASTIEGGGFKVLDPEGEELLFIAEEDILAGIAQAQATGTYATLGTSERLWYGGQPVAIYYLASNEFQLNVQDQYEKLIEFRWTACRNFTSSTSDGCAPSWDRDSSGTCVNLNLY